MNEERDKFLTEAMGRCYHEYYRRSPWCKHCLEMIWPPRYNINFSTWPGFGILWEWSTKQEWWMEFKEKIWLRPPTMTVDICHISIVDVLIHPDRFSNYIYEFLNSREGREGNDQ